MKIKRLCCGILAIMLCMVGITSVFAADSPSQWAEAEILKAKEYQLMTEKASLNYQSNITREEFCELAVKLYEALAGTAAPSATENSFTDTTNPEILKAYQLGIVGGKGNGIFAPNDPVTRQEIAVMLTRTLTAANFSVVPTGEAISFTDKNQIASWAVNAVQFLNEKQIMGGVGENKINPLGNATKEQGIALMVRSYESLETLELAAAAPASPVQNNPVETESQIPFEPSKIAEKVSDAVVLLTTFDENGNSTGTGSGFIIESTGKIITNYHVIHGSYEVMVKLTDGREYPVRQIINYDVNRDIAVIKININHLPTIALGDSNQLLNGQRVLAIGSPLGFDNTISEGLVSNKSRIVEDQNYIQTTAPISSGSSGGVLLDSQGRAIGVTTASIFFGQNLNLAIPINDVKPYLIEKYDFTLVELLDHVRPPVPKNVKAEALSADRIWLSWDEMVEADYFYVYQSDQLNGTYTVFEDDYGYPEWWFWDEEYCLENYGLDPDTTYYYKVSAVKNGIESSLSKAVYATTDNTSKKLYSEYEAQFNNELPEISAARGLYTIVPSSVSLYEEGNKENMYLEMYYYIDTENFKQLYEGIYEGYEDELMEELAGVGMELRDYYQMPVKITFVFHDVFQENPEQFAIDMFGTSDVVYYDYYYDEWYIWQPLIEVDINKTGNSFTHTIL